MISYDDNSTSYFDLDREKIIYTLRNIFEEECRPIITKCNLLARINSTKPLSSQFIGYTSTDGMMKILDPSNKQFVFDMGNPGNIIATSSEKNIFSVANPFGNIVVFRIYEGHEKIDRAHSERISCMVVSPDGRLLVTASWDKTLKIFDLENKVELYHLTEVHEGKRTSI